MDNVLFKNTEVAAYFIWEYTKHTNALDLWYCAENLAFYFENKNWLLIEDIDRYKNLDKNTISYIHFVRSLAYRIYVFTGNQDHLFNWFTAEKLLDNMEWLTALLNLANGFRQIRNGDIDNLRGIRTKEIRESF